MQKGWVCPEMGLENAELNATFFHAYSAPKWGAVDRLSFELLHLYNRQNFCREIKMRDANQNDWL
jgi:hypothetical protein